MQSVREMLSGVDYVGRGILVGTCAPKKCVRVAYFIEGRSENSQNRIFARTADGIETRAFDESKVEDPSLIMYNAVRKLDGGELVVTNGDQTDTICEALVAGKCYRHALKTRTFEPDSPHFTSRISCVVGVDGTYALSILKRDATGAGVGADTGEAAGVGAPEQTLARYYFEYDQPAPNVGHFISTYNHDVDASEPLPAFAGEPRTCELKDQSLEQFLNEVWDALSPKTRIALFSADYYFEEGRLESLIKNAHE